MPTWTKEQIEAINKSDTNIIVSAGAGSGKTAVLTERVITKLKSGISITNLLILTFTKAAASEMKDRIRKAIKKDEDLKKELDYIDSAYITTFDSFSMSVVKKYHYILNVSSHLGIIEKSICDNVRIKILDEIFDKKYFEKDESFLKLINDLTIKDDTEIKKDIIRINSDLDKLINKSSYLEAYISNYYSEDNIKKLMNMFNEYLLKKVSNIEKQLYETCEYGNEKFNELMYNSLSNLIKSKTYDEIKNNINVKLPNVPKGSEDELKNKKKELCDLINSLKKSLIYKNETHIKNTLLSTMYYSKTIIEIIIELDKKLNEYKSINDLYEYNDIAKMAIKIVKENKEIKEELINSFKEIMIDEYQDTSDLQEELITLISNNNLYMVGDIKQSIYRFRNANPSIFKKKYNDYALLNGGIKIDLLNNFRSREEVLYGINDIFNLIMDEKIGGADYKNGHQMNFGNMSYRIKHPNQDFNLEIYNYNRDNKKYKSSEYEAFIIAEDIKSKIQSKYQILDKETNELRTVEYKDFCILLDRKSNFELYKKVFEYLSIPLVIYYDEKITNETDVLIMKNIINLVVKIYKKEFDTEFKYIFYAISRSYVCELSDEEYLNYYVDNNYYESDIYKKCLSISEKLDIFSNKDLIEEIIDKFNFYENTIKVGEIEKSIIRIDYLKTLGENLSSLGYSPIEFNEYLKDMVNNENDVTFSVNANTNNNVKLMNIHKSKGLEFSICYYAGYENKFNKMDLNNRLSFDKNLGFILPFYDDGIGNTVTKEIYKDSYIEEDISERIRLFYVALTRAKEKIIIVANLDEEEKCITDEIRKDYISFKSIIESIKKYIKKYIVEVNNIELTKDYIISKKGKLINKNGNTLTIKEISVENNKIIKNKVSKKLNKIIDKSTHKTLEYGVKIHRLFETTDFNSCDNEIVKNFLENFKNINNAIIYKEYEFITNIDNKEYHGIIDLILEYTDYIDIVDYKLKNVNDENYITQLNIYKDYIKNKTNKKVNIYLYSILDNRLKKID